MNLNQNHTKIYCPSVFCYPYCLARGK